MTLCIVSFEKILVYMLEILHNKLFFEYYWNFFIIWFLVLGTWDFAER